MAVTIHGIRNCNTMKKAFAWLDGRGVTYAFHDYKKLGVSRARLDAWCRKAGWERVINRAGMTFRKLPDTDREELDKAKAIALMLEKPSMIRRPVLEVDDAIEIGFDPGAYERLFGA